jgi:3-hydroxymyristoyl/3-hydroxydecanoyl-(acyl carrier protein) dehydratase
MKFFEAVLPEQRIILRAERLAQVEGLLQFRVEALVNGRQVVAGQIILNEVSDSSAAGEN